MNKIECQNSLYGNRDLPGEGKMFQKCVCFIPGLITKFIFYKKEVHIFSPHQCPKDVHIGQYFALHKIRKFSQTDLFIQKHY